MSSPLRPRTRARLLQVLTVGAVALALLASACGGDAGSSSGTPGATDTDAGGTAAGSAGSGGDPGPGPTSIGDVAIALVEVAHLDSPVDLSARAGTDDLYVAEQGGALRVLHPSATPDAVGANAGQQTFTVDDEPVLDLRGEVSTGNEQGLLGITFSPDGSKLYVDYTDVAGDTHVVELPMVGDEADRSRARELLFVDQPFANHNGGRVVFGPDGFLYIGLGDGGSGGDPNGNGQNTNVLLGKILRIDPTPSSTSPYTVPSDNPFATGGGAAEVWLYGVRNPWRFSFDRVGGDLWIGDVGQGLIEEIDQLPASAGREAGRGANLGWNEMEGSKPFEGGTAPPGAVAPVFDYPHDGTNCSVTGGFVYRGSAVPALTGVYVFGDYCTAELHGLLARNQVRLDERSLDTPVPGGGLTSFGEDTAGELYVLSKDGGVYRITGS